MLMMFACIFCPGRELPFAGHPTLGTCRAWLQQGHTPRVPGLVSVVLVELLALLAVLGLALLLVPPLPLLPMTVRRLSRSDLFFD